MKPTRRDSPRGRRPGLLALAAWCCATLAPSAGAQASAGPAAVAPSPVDPFRVIGPSVDGDAGSAPLVAAALGDDLRQRLATAAPDERLPVYLVMADQLTGSDLRREHAGRTSRERRSAIAQRLKAHAAGSQATVRAALAEAQAAGRAELTDVLWMGNALVLEAVPAVIDQLARLPGVDRVRLVRELSPEQVQDVAPAGAGVAPYPFVDDFDSGALAPWWTVASTGAGRVRVTTEFEPLGSHHVVMDAETDGVDSTASITVTLDLAGRSDVGVRYRFKEMSLNGITPGDEDHPEDGVFLSDDGVNWQRAVLLNGFGAEYDVLYFSLDAAAADLGLSFTSTFGVRFQWRDNFSAPNDGVGFDLIEIGPGVDAEPPAVPTANVVLQQAPLLWQQGFDGDGILVGSIDSGTWRTHPDLEGAIWSNPGEIEGNGLDDDNNGYVDDTWGWDFDHDDNDPQSTDPHGTQSAGLIVGDGTSGTITGMAPGATLVTCGIASSASEVQYWLAMQYLLDVGVDVVTSSYSYKWPERPDYHMFRQLCDVEWAAGIVHSNSIGNQGQQTVTHPVPFNVSTPGNVPSPFWWPGQPRGGRSSVLACGGLSLDDDSLYGPSGRGPVAWDDLTLYDAAWPHPQDPTLWDYPYGGFGGGPGLIKPDLVTYTGDVVTTNVIAGSLPIYTTFSGTSAATPQLGGALALLRQVQPAAEPRHLAAALQFEAVDFGAPGKDNDFGAGHLRVWNAARRLQVLVKAVPDVVTTGGSTELQVYGRPNEPVYGFLGIGITDQLGDFNLQLPFFDLPPLPLDAQGQVSAVLPVPNDPNLVGLVVWFQYGQPYAPGPWGQGKLLSVPEAVLIDG